MGTAVNCFSLANYIYMTKYVTSIIVFFLSFQQLVAQEKGLNVGMGFRGGLSQNSEKMTDDSSIDLYTPLFSYSIVGYGVLNFKSKNLERSPLFPYLRISLASTSSRGGVFDIAGTPTKVSFTNIDFDVMLPIAFRVSNELNFYFGLGGMASVLVAQTKDTPKSKAISPGALAELGIFTTHGSYFSFQVLGVYNEYSTQTFAMTFGISVEDARLSKLHR